MKKSRFSEVQIVGILNQFRIVDRFLKLRGSIREATRVLKADGRIPERFGRKPITKPYRDRGRSRAARDRWALVGVARVHSARASVGEDHLACVLD